jgi:prepilin-type processing-associated H-X9-DG protein/prepilin-type N-terminal cleavage/methylation domain-containing protein
MAAIRMARTTRFGVTLIELLVVVGIVSMLMALLLPAVQASREAARRSRCANNLGQLIRATHSFVATYGGFPPAAFWGRPLVASDHTIGIYSLQCRLLPFLEQGDLYNGINFSLPTGDPLGLVQYHSTAAFRFIDVFLCPSDPSRDSALAPNSYRGCTGLGEMKKLPSGGYSLINEGAFAPIDDDGTFKRTLPLSQFQDGLSNTLAFSEKPIGSSAMGSTYSAFRDWSYLGFSDIRLSADQWAEACSHLESIEPRLDAGASWMMPGAIYTHFYASVPPNSLVPDCGTPAFNYGLGIYAARSYHPGGVNAAMADGSVRWVSSGVQAATWRGMGTRAGSEVISE